MAKTFLQDGDVLPLTAPTGGVSSGDGVLIANVFGVALTDAAEGASVAIRTTGVWTLPKTSGDALAEGALVSWNATTGEVTLPGPGHYPIGVATASAGAGVSSVSVRLDGVATAAAA